MMSFMAKVIITEAFSGYILASWETNYGQMKQYK